MVKIFLETKASSTREKKHAFCLKYCTFFYCMFFFSRVDEAKTLTFNLQPILMTYFS
jgi:hypothetical protein